MAKTKAMKEHLVCRPCGTMVTVSDLGSAVIECYECGVELVPARVAPTPKPAAKALPKKAAAGKAPARKAAPKKVAARKPAKKAAPKKK